MKDTKSLYEKLKDLFEEVKPKVASDLGDGFKIQSIYPLDKLVADKYGGFDGFRRYGRWIESLRCLLSLVMRPIEDKWDAFEERSEEAFQDMPRIAANILIDCLRGCPATVEKENDTLVWHINGTDALNRLDDYIEYGERHNIDQFVEKETLREWGKIGYQRGHYLITPSVRSCLR